MVDNNMRELVSHGERDFPVGVYDWDQLDENGMLLECHWHKEWEFFTIHEGCAYFYVNGEKHFLNEHDVVFIPGNSIHMAEVYENTHCRYQSIVFSMDLLSNNAYNDAIHKKYIKPLLENHTKAKVFFANSGSNEKSTNMYSLFCKVFKTVNTKPKFYEMLAKAYLYELFACTIDSMDIYTKPPGGKLLECSAQSVKNAIKFMEDNINKDITSAQLACVANMSVGHFGKVFKQMTSCSPIEYLMNMRLDNAAQSLIYTNDKISAIAMDSGFNNIGHFNRCFKNKYGCSPKQYRAEKQIQLTNPPA